MELRAYFFGNMYLSSIQQGIQAGHAITDMFVRYQPLPSEVIHDGRTDNAYRMLLDWAENHKTMVLLNAGFGEEIHDLIKFFRTSQNKFPYAPFFEAEEALDGAATTVGIILPETIYNAARLLREGELDPEAIIESGLVHYGPMNYEVSEFEFKLMQRLNQYGLAR